MSELGQLLAAYGDRGDVEAGDVTRVRTLLGSTDDPWSRALPLHVTGSALIVHPATGLVLLRWHARQGAWLQVGGHGDPGESDPLDVCLREAHEETGLTDLMPWPDAALVQVAVVPVPARGDEPGHEHADLRFVLATATPDDVRPEHEDAPLRWLTVPEATALTTQPNLREMLARVGELLRRR